MDITGNITGIKYKILLKEDFKNINIKDFNINESPSACAVLNGNNIFGISKWVSPKRTRSYPYQRVYNTLNFSKKITVIPIIKDEGLDGDRDFLQWDTVSLMSLLDVFVIFAYYNKATKNSKFDNKITGLKFDNKYVLSKIKEIDQYHSSALHWNLNELKNNLHNIVDIANKCYKNITKQTGVVLHNQNGIDNFKAKISEDISVFMKFSREKAKDAQAREILTNQQKENLSTLTKAKITITNYLGGQYFFTVDEVFIEGNVIELIESKHSKTSILPSISDIKDGLLKMILYSNLKDIEVNGIKMKSKVILKLTSDKIANATYTKLQSNLIQSLLDEAKENDFVVKIGDLQ